MLTGNTCKTFFWLAWAIGLRGKDVILFHFGREKSYSRCLRQTCAIFVKVYTDFLFFLSLQLCNEYGV